MMRQLLAVLIAVMATSAASPAERDKYGGWTAIKFEARGKFYVAQRNGVWWLVTPDGNAFFSKGVCGIRYKGDHAPRLGYAPYGRTTARKYGAIEKWASATARRLRLWGFNTIGAWADPPMWRQAVPYTVMLNLGARAGANWLKGTMPDFFDPKFERLARQACRKLCGPRRNDPYVIGYFTDNELSWTRDWRSKTSLLARYLQLPQGSPGRRAAVELLARRGKKPDKYDADDERAFLELAATRYFEVCSRAIRQADPNHLILGCRFAGRAPEPVVRAMKGRIDVVSLNNYGKQPPVKTMARIHQLTGAPVLITEFSFKAMDSGLPNTKGAGKPVATQKDRADCFENYVARLARIPHCVGFHWFKWCDEPKEGRFDGENSNYGLVRIDDEPWATLTERMASVNPGLEAIHANAKEE